MQNHIHPYQNQIFSKYQCDLKKVFNAQHCLKTTIKKWCKFLDTGGPAGALLTDLSEAFDCNEHEILITKPNAYDFETNTLKFTYL